VNFPLSFASVPSENEKVTSHVKIQQWIDLYGDDVLKIAYMYLRDKSKAEDAFQEVFLRAFRQMDTFRGDSSVKTWLLRITMNVCKDLRRSFWFRRVWTGKLPERTADDGLPEQQVIEREQNRGLWEQVLDLPSPLKDVIILYYYQELDVKEIARVLEVPEGTVRSRLHRARERLKKNLEGRG
jgi:RNA polymerase sigma-70 factor (ECF subfamily)